MIHSKHNLASWFTSFRQKREHSWFLLNFSGVKFKPKMSHFESLRHFYRTKVLLNGMLTIRIRIIWIFPIFPHFYPESPSQKSFEFFRKKWPNYNDLISDNNYWQKSLCFVEHKCHKVFISLWVILYYCIDYW